jgi:hypothetical protein
MENKTENEIISLEISGMTIREAQDYCRKRGISCAFLETGPPARRASGKGTAASGKGVAGGNASGGGAAVHKVIRAAAADGSWELLTAPFEDSGIDGDLERGVGSERC